MPSLKFTPNCPLHPEAEHMFDDKLIGKMNVARISSIRRVARSVTVLLTFRPTRKLPLLDSQRQHIRKFIKYAMTGNSAEVWVLFLAPFLFLPIPLLPIHILWINLVTDGFLGLAKRIVWVRLLMVGVSLLVQA